MRESVSHPKRFGNLWKGLALVAMVAVAYLPALRGQFLWDDDDNIINRSCLRSVAGIRRIWLEPGATQQFYPLTHTTFWIDWHLWGLNSVFFHIENVLLHGVSAALLWILLRRLNVRGAWMGAALFALHPVCVESVAWITERKNTLSGVFVLLSMLAGINFWLPAGKENPGCKDDLAPAHGSWAHYFLALLFYTGALCAKTASVCLPGIFPLLIWWKRRNIHWRDLALLIPFAIAGLSMAVITIRMETNMGTRGPDWDFSLVERLFIAARASWFYLEKLLWPHPLMFIYPRWDMHHSILVSCVEIAVMLIVLIVAWKKRDGLGRHVLMAMGCFLAMLLPVLGFFNVCFFQFSFVNDHFQYLALMAPLALFGAVLATMGSWVASGKRILVPISGAAILIALGFLTWKQSGVYRDNETLWRDALRKNPLAWMARNNLGAVLADKGDIPSAIAEYKQVMKLKPDYAASHYNLGIALVKSGDIERAIDEFRTVVRLQPTFAPGHTQLGLALAARGKSDDALEEFHLATAFDPNDANACCNYAVVLSQVHRTGEAVEQYRQALALDPDSAGAMNNLAWLLASSTDAQFRDGVEAVRLAERACQLNHYQEPLMLGTLAAAYAEAARFDDAVSTAQRAQELAAAIGNTKLAEKNRQLVELFKSGRPYREEAGMNKSGETQ